MNPRDIERRLKENKKKIKWREPRSSFYFKNGSRNYRNIRRDPGMENAFAIQLETILKNEMENYLPMIVPTIIDALRNVTLEKTSRKILDRLKDGNNLSDKDEELLGDCFDTYLCIPIMASGDRLGATSDHPYNRRMSGSREEVSEAYGRIKNLWPEKYHLHLENEEEE